MRTDLSCLSIFSHLCCLFIRLRAASRRMMFTFKFTEYKLSCEESQPQKQKKAGNPRFHRDSPPMVAGGGNKLFDSSRGMLFRYRQVKNFVFFVVLNLLFTFEQVATNSLYHEPFLNISLLQHDHQQMPSLNVLSGILKNCRWQRHSIPARRDLHLYMRCY